MHDGIYDFQKAEIKALFSSNKTFRDLALKETGKGLFETKKFLIKNDKKTNRIITQVMKKTKEVSLKKDTPIVQYSHKINRSFYHRKKIMEEADLILSDLIDRGGHESITKENKKEEIQFMKAMIRQDPNMQHSHKKIAVSTRYRSNDLHGIKDVKLVISKLLLTDCKISKEYFRPIRKNHFPRSKTLKSSAKNKKTRKTRG